ncbi:dnaJ homolog subfamily C member 30, mitochondrial-like [Venturia canescens]|uniref:dnaJ homolog subfamily C member 30, mitochondrial-like n=1 Tax=Venturia canescens TaxID=32260 RepID=UPI001C9CD646|nr:dnaJ homolog subfamily C member 30, mitochondrial-like [Venturia canescens]
MRMSTKPKTPSHYDTLEINYRATQGEIKSAYFNLSKQYHPDKNDSEEASQKFRDISNAYEVLSNFKSRKVYDRSLIIKPKHQKQHGQSTTVDPKIQYYQTQAAIFKQDAKTGSTPMYDFDEWTRAHYGRTLKRNIQDKEEAERLRELRQHFESSTSHNISEDRSMFLISILLFGTVVFLGMYNHSDDLHLALQEKEKFEKKKIPENSKATTNSISSD